MRVLLMGLPLFLLATGCNSVFRPVAQPVSPIQSSAPFWPQNWDPHLGQTVTLEGEAADAKLGALLLGESNAIWIDGLDYWPDGFYPAHDKGKRLRVTGTVIKRDDLPVFLAKPGGIVRQSVGTVETEEELEKTKWRFLLKDAKWVVLE